MGKKRHFVKSISFHAKKVIIKIDVNIISMDSTCIKVYPDGMGALKKRKAVYCKNTRRMEYKDSYGCRI